MDRHMKLHGHFERNRHLLKVFREKRVDLEESRPVELHFWARGQPNSVRLASELYKRGFTLLQLRPAQRPDNADLWNIEAGTTASISRVTSEEFVAMLTDVAAACDADYDGWGTSV
jgi:hypothetical protein